MTDKLDKLPQEYFDDNRERFNASSSIFDLSQTKNTCEHNVERVSYGEVKCKKCQSGWYDQHRFIIENGKITGIQ